MHYDRRHIEAVKQKQPAYQLPFIRYFVIVAALAFALTVVLH